MDLNLLFGIEIDGSQHQTDDDQVVNDSMKNNFFAINGIPLLRFTAKEVRDNIEDVVAKIIATSDEADKREHVMGGEISEFKPGDVSRSDDQDWLRYRKQSDTV